jgi:hypothetical protein
MSFRRILFLFAPTIVAGLVGCTVPPPKDSIAAADLAVKQALSSKASESAPLDLRLAVDKLDRAEVAMSQNDNTLARRLAEEALVDAQVAEAKTGSDEARRTVIEAQKTLDNLRSAPQG